MGENNTLTSLVTDLEGVDPCGAVCTQGYDGDKVNDTDTKQAKQYWTMPYPTKNTIGIMKIDETTKAGRRQVHSVIRYNAGIHIHMDYIIYVCFACCISIYLHTHIYMYA